ncbi:DUF1697 domain-containing protein [Quadrisphaera sp. GCM10027208]|uniref:DUF1697 domain-containing protein n=1 Tax=Quadrisphaera sp. GCM10027208 TaxID=3273423 RepID=UPI00360C9304
MTVMVGLLRGVNVGGSGRVAMADLRAATLACGYTDIATYGQSGNIVFRAVDQSPATAADALRSAIAGTTTVRPDVVRTPTDLHAVISASPFTGPGVDPLQLRVLFLPDHVPGSLGGIDLSRFAPEQAAAIGREVHLYLPGGTGRSRLAAAVHKHTMAAGTQRNWRTVTAVAALADHVNGAT